MDIDRQTIKAVSADARLKMLKSLKTRKKMPSELSKEIGLSPSTVVEHLQNLEGAGLIKRIETGHKWVYYELTDKGSNIVQPRMPLQFALTLAIGLLLTSFGLMKKASVGAQKAALETLGSTALSSDAVSETGRSAVQTLPFDWSSFLIPTIGLLLVIFSSYMILRRRY